jgi:hypothetical protein
MQHPGHRRRHKSIRSLIDCGLSYSHQRDAFQKHAEEQNALLSPVRSLPPELLAEIFSHCIPAWRQRASPYIKRATMLCSHVCGQWRDIALSTPRLWACLSFSIHKHDSSSTDLLNQLWLSRTGECPLTLHISLASRSLNIRSFVNHTLPPSHRWQHLFVMIIPGALKDFAAAVGPVPRLETLDLQCRLRFVPSGTETLPVTIFESAPKLHVVDLDFQNCPFGIRIPWCQLTDLKVSNCSVDKCLDVLSGLPNLVAFDVHLVDPRGLVLERRPVLQLSRLKKLQVRSGQISAYLFDHLLLSALRTFEYHKTGDCSQEVISLLSRSSCSLRKFTCRGSATSRHNHPEILRMSPDLVELDIGAISSITIAQLTNQGSSSQQSPCLVPKLRILRCDRGSEFDDQGFVDMVESRWRLDETATATSGSRSESMVSQIDTVEVRCVADTFDKLAFSRLNEFAGEGLKVRFD